MSDTFLHGLNTPREFTIEFLRVLLSRKLLILLVFLATVLSAYTYVQLMTERYQSEATLLVTIGRENTELPVSVARGQLTTLGVRQEEINSNISLLKSRFLVTDVVDEMGPDAFRFEIPEPTNWIETIKYRAKNTIRWVKKQYQEFLIFARIEKRLTEREQTIDYVHKFLEVDRVRDSDTIRVAISLPDPQLAKIFQEKLLDRYLERHISVRSTALSDDFFKDQVNLYRSELDKLDDQIVDLRSSRELSTVERQRDLLLERLAKVKEELDECHSQLNMLPKSELSDESDIESGVDASHAGSLFPVYHSEKLKDYAMEKYLDRLAIVASRGDQGVELKSLDEETDRIERELSGGLKRRIAQLETWKSELQTRLETLNTGEVALQKLERDRLLNQQSYFKYTQRLEDDRIDGELDKQRISNVAVLTPPTITFQPVYPSKKLWLVVSIVGGLIAGVGLALVLAYMDDKIRSPRDVSAIDGIDVLGTIRLPRRSSTIQEVSPIS